LAVPVDAVTTLDGQDVVFLADDEPGVFRPAAVGLGRRAGAFYEVKRGLHEGDRVAATGTFTLKSVLRAHELSDGDSN
jgi:cobalt-zinc-cadmium efflux system membrane fusion protein